MNYAAVFLLLGVVQLDGMTVLKDKEPLTRRNSLELEVMDDGKVAVSRKVVDKFHEAKNALLAENGKLRFALQVSDTANKQLITEVERLVLQNQALYASANYLNELQKNNGVLFPASIVPDASDVQKTVTLSVEKVTDLTNKLNVLSAFVRAGSDPARIAQNTALRQQHELLVWQASRPSPIPQTLRECRMILVGMGIACGATVLQQLLYNDGWCVCLP